jgi:hypothetical protein
MNNILIFVFIFASYFATAQNIYTSPTFTYNGQTYNVSLGEPNEIIFIKNSNNKSGTGYFPQVTGNYLDCTPKQVFDVRYLINKAKEAIDGAIDAQTRTDIRNHETFEVRLIVTKENKVEAVFVLRPDTIITKDQIYAMDMAIRQIPITFNPTGDCVGINLSTMSTFLSNQPSTDQ